MNDFGPLTKLPNNVGNLSKTIVATGFEWLPKVQKMGQSGHTVRIRLTYQVQIHPNYAYREHLLIS